jgi:hypothetical protein
MRLVFLLWSCLSPLSATSDTLFSPVETSVEASISFEDLSFSPAEVLRYRFVYVDADYLWTVFESAESVEHTDDERFVRITLFDDLAMELRPVKVSISIDRLAASGVFIDKALPLGDELRERTAAEIALTRDGRAWADIGTKTDQYGLFPVNSGPIHVIVHFDAQEARATD